MVRKTATAAAIAAGMILTVANIEGSGAFAQDISPHLSGPAHSHSDAAERVPVFVENEVVQALPQIDSEDEVLAASDVSTLAELVSLTDSEEELSEELHCLAGAIYFESRGEPLAGQLAVAQVIVNRTESGTFPASYCGVVTQRSQFSFVRNGRIPAPRTGSSAWRNAKAIARIAHQGLWESEAEDALYFHARYVKPRWSRTKIARATIDSHIFYK